MKTKLDGIKELIHHAATHETVSPLETMFDVVDMLPWDDHVKDDLNMMIFGLITAHPKH